MRLPFNNDHLYTITIEHKDGYCRTFTKRGYRQALLHAKYYAKANNVEFVEMRDIRLNFVRHKWKGAALKFLVN